MVGLCITLPKAGRGQRTILGQGNINILTQEGLGGKAYGPVVKGESLSLGDSHPESSLSYQISRGVSSNLSVCLYQQFFGIFHYAKNSWAPKGFIYAFKGSGVWPAVAYAHQSLYELIKYYLRAKSGV